VDYEDTHRIDVSDDLNDAPAWLTARGCTAISSAAPGCVYGGVVFTQPLPGGSEAHLAVPGQTLVFENGRVSVR
jgi:hypothetical protein